MAPPSNATPARLITAPFVAVMVTTLVFFFYIGMVVVTIPSFVERDLDAGEFGVGLTMASFAAAAILARPILGRLTERYGRRKLMVAGALLASAATLALGFATELWHVLLLRAFMGLGEAGLFVAAATLIADLSPATRRAEAASYFSVAVFGGMGVGPLVAEWIIGDDAYTRTFFVAGMFAALSAVTVLGVPARVDHSSADAGKQPLFNRAALWPGLVLCSGIAAFSVFMAFVPEYSKTVGLAGAGALFFAYSMVSILLRVVGAKLPERMGEHLTVTIALVAMTAGMLLIAAVVEPWALWGGTVLIGVGMAFLYPALMANVVNRVGDNERAGALSSFTMFFEVGAIVGGVVLGAVGEIFSKRAAFIGGALAAMVGLVLLWQFVTASPVDQAETAQRDSAAPVLTR